MKILRNKNMQSDEKKLFKKGLLLEYFTVIWNVIEALVAIIAGIVSGSIALVGFGLDSVIEFISGSTLIWRLKKHGLVEEEEETKSEKRAVLIVGITFFLLALYILYESGSILIKKEPPQESTIGILLSAISLIVMPFLGISKRRVAKKINSKALLADSVETMVCSYLSLTLFIGLGANALFGWWWADPIAALIMVIFIIKEGCKAVREGLEKKN